MLWVKAFHIVFVVAWYAGLLYLPRLFVYHAQTDDAAGDERFRIMERKLFGIMTVAEPGRSPSACGSSPTPPPGRRSRPAAGSG